MILELSKYRTSLMGFAIIWIMMFHFFNVPYGLSFLWAIGYAGVDVFIFLSAYGLYQSMHKGTSLMSFYRRRLLRIFPAYYICLISFSLINGEDILTILQKMSMLGYFLPMLSWGYFLWYIPAICVLYLLFPLFYKYRKVFYNWKVWIILFILMYALNFFILRVINGDLLFLLPPRVIVLALGVLYADIEYNGGNVKIPVCKSICLFVVTYICLFLIKSSGFSVLVGLSMIWFIPIPLFFPGIYVLVKKVTDKVPMISNIFLFCGTYSLEIYLLHENLKSIIQSHLKFNGFTATLIAILLSFPLAFLINIIIRTVSNCSRTTNERL